MNGERSSHRNPLPDFLGIGAQRAGTTWLSQNLRQHPDIWMPSIKELHYFDRSYRSTPSALSVDGRLARIFGRKHHSARWRRALRRTMSRIVEERDWQEIPWHIRFFLGRYDDGWYASLFNPAGDRLKGEITPAYSFLRPREIKHIKDIMPQVKIIFLIRNPVERSWSAIKYHIWRRATGQAPRSSDPIDALSLDDFKRIAEKPGFVMRGDYVRTIENWSACFPRSQFFIGFFEDIAQNPQHFLMDLFDFLGVAPSDEHISQRAFKRANPSPKKPMPEKLRLYLTERYYPQMKVLSEVVGGYAIEWQEEAEKLLQSG